MTEYNNNIANAVKKSFDLIAIEAVGSEVVKQLLSSGQHVRETVHLTTSASSDDKLKKVELVKTGYNKPETLVSSFKGVDKLFLLAAVSPNATELTSNLVTEAKKAGIRYIVRLSIMRAGILDFPWIYSEDLYTKLKKGYLLKR